MIKQIVQIEATLFSIQLPAYGSIYYGRDLEPNCRRVKIPDQNGVKQLCNGPDTTLGWWHDYRDLLPVDHVSNITFTESQITGPKHYIQVALFLIPKDRESHRPIIRHPDLHPPNIFVSDGFKIVGIID